MPTTDQNPRNSQLDDVVLASRHLATRALIEAVDLLAPQTAPVLLLGEPGSGRGALARRLHERGPAPGSPFVSLDCAGLESLYFIENAGRGTVLLREIEALAPALQEGLWRLLGGRGTALRLVASGSATAAVGVDRKLSPRLLDAFSGACLHLSPLRERAADVPELVARLLDRSGRSLRVGEAVMGYLVNYDWPGNVDELAQVVDRLCVNSPGPWASPDALPPQIRWFPGNCSASTDDAEEAPSFDPLGEEFQLRLIADALRRTHRR